MFIYLLTYLFYRSVLTHDALHEHGPWQDICLSVCLSVTCRYCIEMVKHIPIIFSKSGSSTIFVIPY